MNKHFEDLKKSLEKPENKQAALFVFKLMKSAPVKWISAIGAAGLISNGLGLW